MHYQPVGLRGFSKNTYKYKIINIIYRCTSFVCYIMCIIYNIWTKVFCVVEGFLYTRRTLYSRRISAKYKEALLGCLLAKCGLTKGFVMFSLRLVSVWFRRSCMQPYGCPWGPYGCPHGWHSLSGCNRCNNRNRCD